MGHVIFIQKFDSTGSGIIPFEELESILQQYGSIVEDSLGFEFISNVGNICEHASLAGKSKDSIYGVTFSRPTDHPMLPVIVFDLLSLGNTCLFDPVVEYIHTRSHMEHLIPEPLLKAAESDFKVVKTPDQLRISA